MTSMSTPSGRVIFMMTISSLNDGLQKCRTGGLRKVAQVACEKWCRWPALYDSVASRT